jgi:hypothetical protein
MSLSRSAEVVYCTLNPVRFMPIMAAQAGPPVASTAKQIAAASALFHVVIIICSFPLLDK